MEPPPDTTPPTIVSVSPANAGMGIRKDADVVITFSEPMNRQRTEDAYSSARLPANAVAFQWSADSRVLTVNPNADFSYDSPFGTRQSYQALNPNSPTGQPYAEQPYIVGIDHTAEDLAGNRMASDVSWMFWILRRFVPLPSMLSQLRVSTTGSTNGCSQMLFVGDRTTNEAYMTVASFVSPGVSLLPNGIVEFEVAELRTDQVQTDGAPFATSGLGTVHVYHLGGAEISSVTWNTTPLRDLGVLADAPINGPRAIDVRAALSEDYAQRTARGNRSTYAIHFTEFTDGDGVQDGTYFQCSTMTLAITYLAP